MKVLKLSLALLLGIICLSCNDTPVLTSGAWKLTYDADTKSVNIEKNSKLVFNNLYPSFRLEDRLVTSKDYEEYSIEIIEREDQVGKASIFQITYTGKELPLMVQSFYMYPGQDFVLTDFMLKTNQGEILSNYMVPVNIDTMATVLNKGENRALFIPFDNDCFGRYQSHALTFDTLRAYEITAIFNNDDRNGIIIGSVEHDKWKTGIDMKGSDGSNIKSLICYGGVADVITRDIKAHGALRGSDIKSPKIMLGFFSDWRAGLEEFGKINNAITPKAEWKKAMPFGWNSWGVLQFGLTYPKALEVSDFFKENLQSNSFVSPDNTLVVGLDSGWNSFTEAQLKSFVQKCKENGQIAGIYWTPFTDWSKSPERIVDDVPEYKNKDIYLYANGKPQELDGAYAVDPTHPAIEQKMKTTSELFRRCGFEYVKMDFMGHGAMEADKWYRGDIQTGIEAYNYGMKLLVQYFGDMYINLSISPIFPAQYAQSRRIACDAWNKIKDTEYTMNAVSYGWWIDNVYQYNDADHIVLQEATEGENRARVTSAVITGLYIAGDDFSKGGSEEGKSRAKKYLTNAPINALASGRSFRPVEGAGDKSENQFTQTDKDGNMYYVIFNYGEKDLTAKIPFVRLGLPETGQYQAKELWSGETIDSKAEFIVPNKDVKVIQISKI